MENPDGIAYPKPENRQIQGDSYEEAIVAVAKIIEITATSDQSFENAIAQGVGKAVQNINDAWVKEQKVLGKNGSFVLN